MLSLRESHTGSSRALAALDAAIEAWTAGNTGDVPYPFLLKAFAHVKPAVLDSE
jgi:hypothetical protein